MNIGEILLSIVILLPGLVVAITLHEAAHGYVASWLGDNTARYMGRLSLNPLRHVDPIGTLLVPGALFLLQAPFLFGWAKPVPVDWRYLKHPRQDMALIALAGPCINLIIAVLSALLIHIALLLPREAAQITVGMLQYSILINCVIAIINLLPIPPLDGGRVLIGLLPEKLAWQVQKIEPIGFFLLISLIFLVPMAFQFVGVSFDPWRSVLEPLITGLGRGIHALAGLR